MDEDQMVSAALTADLQVLDRPGRWISLRNRIRTFRAFGNLQKGGVTHRGYVVPGELVASDHRLRTLRIIVCTQIWSLQAPTRFFASYWADQGVRVYRYIVDYSPSHSRIGGN